MKALYLVLAVLIVAGCQSAASVLSNAQPAEEGFSSRLYDLSAANIPADHVRMVEQAVRRADSLSTAPSFLADVRSKNTYTFTDDETDGATVAQVLERAEQREGGERVRPRLVFYSPPTIGRDVCGGWSWWFVRKTSTTGCTLSDGMVYRSQRDFPSDPDILAEFLLHEWMHVAGFGHEGNRNQCSQQKRNSVPIYVGCLSRASSDPEKVAACSLSCQDAAADADDER